MSKVALVSHDVPTIRGRAGGVGTFVVQFATLLSERGEDVTIILTRQETEPTRVDENWRRKYESLGIGLIEIHNTPPSADRWSDAWPARLSELVAPTLRGFDIAYFQDWANVAFQAAREKRFRPAKWPLLVTVLHGPSNWTRMANRKYPNIPEDLHVEFIERYSARHSDRVVAPSRYILNWARREGWTFPAEPDVLGLPYLPPPSPPAPGAVTFQQIVFFGRLETRKGFSLFADSLRRCRQSLTGLERVVLLGHQDEPGAVEHIQRELAGVPVIHLGDLDSDAAAGYLRAHCADSLVVIPSPVENFPYSVIEASSIPGLNALYSSGGGVREIFDGAGADQFFDPNPRALAAKLVERWFAPSRETAFYDYASANQRWLRFHFDAIRRPGPRPSVAAPDPRRVDVCVTYFNKAEYFPQLLEALERQTAQGFGLIAVDDGSSDATARATFDSMAGKYAARGWTFFRQENMFVDAARNQAAKRSTAEFLLFIDADDIPAPHTVERLLCAALAAGDDCLICGGLLLDGDSVRARYMPLGPNLVSGLVDPIVFGPPMIFIRRTVFESLGGYREVRGAAHEDWELQVRLLLAGHRTDVVPEFLLHFRKLEDGLALTSDDFTAKRRLIDTYEDQFARLGLHGAANTMHALFRRCQQLEKAAREQAPPDVRQLLHDRVRAMLEQKRRS
jgi:glycosyltransferase involved in cell wall biosynthesis